MTASPMILPPFFVTGTDTHIGKTAVSCALLRLADQSGLRAVGLKPVAAGCDHDGEQWRNEDIDRLASASNVSLQLAELNRYLVIEPIAPHIGAQRQGLRIELPELIAHAHAWRDRTDFLLLEGVGGWAAPLSQSLQQADLARALDASIILVVGLRLGCLNHALLTARAIAADGLRLAGWVGTQVDPRMAALDNNVLTLRERIHAPCLGVIPYQDQLDMDAMAAYLELP